MGRLSRLGNDLYDGDVSIDFVGRKWLWYTVSGIIVILAVAGLYFKGLNFGIEFEGGVEYNVSVASGQATQTNVDKIASAVADTGIDAAASPIVNTSGETSRVQTAERTRDEANQVTDAIAQAVNVDAQNDISATEVGASWGEQVAKRALTGLVVFLVLVVLFIWAYFREWKMSVAAIVALIHDIVITIGIYALSGFEVTPATVTGLLTILGFSLYDTVVVFDKVRENTKNLARTRQTYGEAANLAVNQTLVRSINTSIVALIPVGAILYVGAVQLGSGSLKDLALALFVGMAAGAYSSIFIATPLLVQLKAGESEVKLAEKRSAARRREVDPYAAVPAFTEDMPIQAEPGDRPLPAGGDTHAEPAGEPAASTPRGPEAMGRGRVAPPARGPVGRSGAAGRQPPSRPSRAKRGKK